jgi:hypothetical protein
MSEFSAMSLSNEHHVFLRRCGLSDRTIERRG